MKRIQLVVAVVTVSWVCSVAWAVPPDQVANSAVPPLRETPREREARAVRARLTQRAIAGARNPGGAAITPAPGPVPAAAASPPVDASATPSAATSPGLQGDHAPVAAGDVDADRAAIWDSPEMREARAWVIEYSRRSAQSSVSEGRQFLTQLSQLSPQEMQNWLERYRRARGQRVAHQNVEAAARQLMVEQAVSRQEATRQAFDSYNQYRSEAADWMRQRFQTQSQFSQILRNGKVEARDAGLRADLAQNFDPFDPTFDQSDPASPKGWRRKYAASASLPGDLPRGDPRNNVVDVVDVGPNGGGTVVLEGGGTVPNDGGASAAAVGDAGGGSAE